MQYSGVQVLSFVALLLGTAAIVVSVATDYWSFRRTSDNDVIKDMTHRGLWRVCTEAEVLTVAGKSCKNRFDISADDGTLKFKHSEVGAWEIACLALMTASALLGVLSLLFSPCCCNRCGLCLTFWVLLATLCCAAGVGLYGYQTMSGSVKTIDFLNIKITTATEKYHFGWSFWVAVAGGALQLFATLGFGVSRARQHSYSHTI